MDHAHSTHGNTHEEHASSSHASQDAHASSPPQGQSHEPAIEIPEHNKALTPFANAVVTVFEEKEKPNHEPKISVNRFVSELASWYEKLRNAMELDDSVLLKNAIERILKRRLLLGGTGDKVAEPLLRELVWAHYFPDNSLPESMIGRTAEIINLYQELKHKIHAHHPTFSENTLNGWILDFMSCEISVLLAPNKERSAMSNFMYHILKDGIRIQDDSEDTKNVQVYVAVRRAFAKDDLPFLRFLLFKQIFSDLTLQSVDEIAQHFVKGYKEIQRQLNYKLKEKIFLYVKRQTPIFIILDDILRKYKGKAHHLLANDEEFGKAVLEACSARYKDISSKVRRAIVRSVIFLLLTKVAFAFLVEGTYDNFVYGHWQIKELAINIIAPPLLMIIVSFFIKTPGVDNSHRILKKILSVLYDERPQLSPMVTLHLTPKKGRTVLSTIFGLLWLAAFGLSFGGVYEILNKLGFNLVSEGVFIFFITIVSFLAYRITLTAHAYNVDAGQSLFTPFIDLLFLPIIKVGMKLTDGISTINPFILIFDFLIEAPFKTIFGFFEQLFVYLHSKREDLE